MTTFNASTIGWWNPSLNHKLNLDYNFAPGRTLDLRIEYFTDGSYNADPPGQLRNNVNEQKFETQLTYSHPLTQQLSAVAAALHHENYRFTDTYDWGSVGLTYIMPIREGLIFTNSLTGERRFAGGRYFFDYSGTVDWDFRSNWTLECNLHQYENFGQEDDEPTLTQEYELGVIRKLSKGRFAALSFFRHIEYHGINDQFSFLKVKYGFTF